MVKDAKPSAKTSVKMGLYCDLMAEPMTIYIDEYRKRELAGNAF